MQLITNWASKCIDLLKSWLKFIFKAQKNGAYGVSGRFKAEFFYKRNLNNYANLSSIIDSICHVFRYINLPRKRQLRQER